MKGISFYNEDFFVIKQESDLIKENITRILVTSPGERVMSEFGCRLKNYIFDPEYVMEEEVRNEIFRSIKRWEPRVEIEEITTEMKDSETAYIKISLVSKTTLEPFSYEAIIRL